ncbi:VOC family protein [Edwardsiella anguillarum]|uniref:VOC family protein n=1 Tax=Edwardsiella anguillarum TaxID=1821960 RepID=UPI0024B6FBEC|nr:VOC family protein [Edwardsiella anguillarum]WHP81640.1 VOC family protein [Edwardsiella anguillarum]WHQ19142.1 VOC family protein [Edwardsiella anguillarum]WHQ22687.1 VOC family protein [Edwardsiella anguillarum]WHQ26210.1 VOC family protein [Edwardsiella anguillarum]WHQ29725.1 VOC family protein [Edwardsiella anguillarum]
MNGLADIDELRELAADLVRFEQALTHLASALSLDLAHFTADHISLRCHQTETADRWRRGFLRLGTLLAENIINGRPICLFDLAQPLRVGPWLIDCVELPYPGEKRYPHQGWQHVELVLAGPPDTLHRRALALLPDEALLAPGIRLTFSHPRGEGERLPNPTLAVGDRLTTLKFHPYSLREIVASERR